MRVGEDSRPSSRLSVRKSSKRSGRARHPAVPRLRNSGLVVIRLRVPKSLSSIAQAEKPVRPRSRGGAMASKPQVLAAFTRHVLPYLEKAVGHYVDVIPARTVEDAIGRLREDPSI